MDFHPAKERQVFIQRIGRAWKAELARSGVQSWRGFLLQEESTKYNSLFFAYHLHRKERVKHIKES